MSKVLSNNPFFQKDEEPEEEVLTPEEVEIIKESLKPVDDFMTMSFKVRKDYVKLLRDYAYTNRLEIKEALDDALKTFFETVDTSSLLEYPEKPRKPRRRG